jgi:hypothetical protein
VSDWTTGDVPPLPCVCGASNKRPVDLESAILESSARVGPAASSGSRISDRWKRASSVEVRNEPGGLQQRKQRPDILESGFVAGSKQAVVPDLDESLRQNRSVRPA